MLLSRIPTIVSVTLVTTGVEQQVDLQTSLLNGSIKRVQLKSKTLHDLRYSYVTGGPYVTIFSSQTYWQDGIDAHLLSMFLIGSIDGQIAELEYWQ